MLELDRQRINKQGLGRIVAAFKPDYAFICHGASFQNAIIHDAFRSSFQTDDRPGSIDGSSVGSIAMFCALRNFEHRGSEPIAPNR